MKRLSIFFPALLAVFFLAPTTASAALILLVGGVSGDSGYDDSGSWAPGSLKVGITSSGPVLMPGQLLMMGGASLTTGSPSGAAEVGFTAPGELTLIDGTWTANGSVIVGGQGADSPGVVNLYGGTWAANDVVSIGSGLSEGAVNLNGGTMSVAGSDLTVGANGLLTIGGGILDLSGDHTTGGLRLLAGEVRTDGLLTGLEGATGGRVVLQGSSARWETADTAINGLTLDGATLEVTNGGSAAFSSDIQFTAAGGTILLDNAKLIHANQTLLLDGNSISGTGEVVVGSAGLNLGTAGSPGTLSGGTTDVNSIALYGNVSGSGTVENATIFGDLTVGSSFGQISLENVVLNGSGLVEMEIGGVLSTDFDRLFIGPGVDLDGAEFRISFTDFSPSLDDTFNIFPSFGGADLLSTLGGATMTTPEGWTVNLSSGTLVAVPEPGTLLLLATGLLAAAALRRRRSQSA